MEAGEARDLTTLLAPRQPLDTWRAVYIILECCKALADELPRAGLSPRDILIAQSGEVVLGVSEHQASDFGYLSPEAANGLEPDLQSAVFSLGSILGEMLAGRPMFLGDTPYQTVELVRLARVPRFLDVRPELESIVRKALAKSVDDRYQSPRELGEALARYLTTFASS
jgi:hypothetical protein